MIQRGIAFEGWDDGQANLVMERIYSDGIQADLRLRRSASGAIGQMFVGVYREDGSFITEQIFDVSTKTNEEAWSTGTELANFWSRGTCLNQN